MKGNGILKYTSYILKSQELEIYKHSLHHDKQTFFVIDIFCTIICTEHSLIKFIICSHFRSELSRMPNQTYQAPIVPPDLRREETIKQICDSLDYLEKISIDIFNRISNKVTDNHNRLRAINDRVNLAQAKIEKIKGSNKATKVFSSAKYPAEETQQVYSSIYKEADKLQQVNIYLNKGQVIQYLLGKCRHRLVAYHHFIFILNHFICILRYTYLKIHCVAQTHILLIQNCTTIL